MVKSKHFYVCKKRKYIKRRKYYKLVKYSKKDLIYLLSILYQHSGDSEYCNGVKSCIMVLHKTKPNSTITFKKICSDNTDYNKRPFKTNFGVNNCCEISLQDCLGPFIHPFMQTKVYRCQLNVGTKDGCCSLCNSDAMFEVMKGLYDCYKKKTCDKCNCVLCEIAKLRSSVESKISGTELGAKKVNKKGATEKVLKEKGLVKSASEVENVRGDSHLSRGTKMDKKFEEKLTKQDKKAEKEAKITEKGKDEVTNEIKKEERGKQKKKEKAKKSQTRKEKKELSEDETVSEEQFKKEKRCSSAPKTASQNLRDSIAHAENIIIPLESKTLSQKEVALRKMAAVGALLPEGRTLSEKALITCVKEATRTVPKVCSEKVKKAKAEGLLTPSEDKSPCEYEKMIRKLHQQGLPLPEPKTAEKKALIEKIKKDEVSMKLKNVTKSEHVSKTKQVRPTSKISTKKLKRLKSAGLLTPLNGKSTERKEKILRGLAINDVPLPVAKTSSEKKIIDKVRRDLGLPPQPRTSSENLKYKKATAKGLITPLDAKSMAQKEKILRGLADIGVPLPEGRTPSEKALIGQIKTKTSSKVPTTLKPSITNIPSQRIRKSKDGGLMTPLEGRTPSEKALITHAKETRSSVSEQTCSEKLKELEKEKKLKEIEEKCKKAKAGGLQTPLEGKTRAQKQKVLQDLAKHGLPLPEGKTPSEKKIIDKVRKEMGYPAEPKTLSQKLRVTKAHAEGVITPLEGKTALQKEVALKKMAAARVPLPEGRTASEKALITRIKETRSSVCKQTSSEKLKELEKEKKLKEIEEKLKKDKAEGLLTPLEGKTRAQKQKILRDLVKHGLPLPEGKTPSEKKIIDKVRKEMGYPVEPKTLSQKLRVTKAHAEGIITPLEGKTASQKEVALKKMAAAGVPLPEGRTASEKALITHVKETPETEGIRRAKSISPPMSPKKFEKFDINTAKSLKEGKKSDECICNIFNVPAKMSPTVKPLHEKSPEEKEEHIRGLVTRGLPLPQPNTASEKKIIDKVIMEMGYPPEPKTTTQKLALAKAHEASIIKPLQGMTRPEKEKTLRKMAAAGVLLPEGRTASEKSLIAAIKATSPRLSKIASEKIRQAKAEGLLTPLEGKIDSEKERILRGRAKKGLPLPEGKTASEKRIINKVRKEMGYPPEPTCVSEKLRLTKAHAEGIIEPLEGKSDKDKEKMLQQMAAAGIPLPEGRTPSEKALIAAVTTPATVPTEKLTKSKTKERASGFKADPDKLRKAEVKKKTTKKEESVSPKLKTSAEKGTLEKPAGKKRTEKVTTPKGSRYKKSKSVTTTAAGAGIRGEIENIAITTTCDRSCGCDKKKIRFKHSYVKIRVTSPDFSSLCDCPDECIPCVQSGIILDNEGIKVTVGRVAGFPSFTPNLPRRKTLQDSRYVSLEHSFISLYQNVVRNSYLNVLKEALCKNLYEMYKAKMNHTWETESNIRHPSQLQRRLRKDCVYNVQGGYFVGGGHSEISFHRAEADRLFYEPERSYISSAKDTASAHNFNKNESTISTNLKCMSHDSILIMRTESTLSLLSNAYSELGSVSVVSFLGSTMSANNSRRSQSLPNVSNSDMDTDPYFQDLYCNTTKATLSTVYADSDSSKSFLQYTHSKDNDVLVYRISKHNLKEDENNKLNVDPLTDKSVAAISEKSEVESEDLFKIVRELLDHEFIGRRSSVYLLVSSNEADSDASSEANDSIINIKLCGFKNSKDKGNSINSIQVLFSNKTEKKKANDTLMIEVTAEQFYKKDRKLHGFTSKESTDTKNFNDIDKQNRKVHINTFKCNPITKKTKYAKRNIYRHDVRRTVLMHHQSTITEVNKSTGTMTHCGITAERPFEEHCRDAKMNTSAAADRPRWCRQHSAPNLAEPVKLISSNVQFIGNINILPEKVPRGITPEIFLSFGENLMWQCKDPSPEQLLGRIGRMGSEGTLSFANAFPECFKEDTQKTSYLKCSCDYRRKALFREGFSNGTRTEPPPTKFGTYPRVCYQSSFGTTHKPIVRDQSGQTHKKVCSSCTRRLGRRIKNCDHNLSEDDEDIWIEETKKQSLTYNAKYNKHHRKRKMLKSSRNDLISYQPGDIASLGSCRATYCEVNVTGVPSLRSTLHQYFCQHERRKGEVYAVPSCSCCMSPHQNSTVLDLINYKKDKKVKRERQSSVVRALRAGTGPIIPQRRPSCEPCCCAARNICEEQKSKEDDAASAAVLSSGPVIVARSCTSFCRRASAPMSALEILTTPVPGQLITLCDPCGHKRKGYIEVLHPPPSQRTSLAAGLYQDIYEGYACNKWDYEGKLDQYTDAPDMSVIVTKNLLKNLKDLRDTLIPILADTGLDLQGEPQSMVHTADEALSPTRTSNASVEPTMSEQKYSSDSVTRHRPKLKDFLDPATLPPNMPMPEYEVDKDGNLHINVDSYARSTSLPSHHLQQYNRLGGTSTCSMVVPEEDCNIACDGVACQITGNKPVLRGMSTCSMVVPEEDCNFECEGVACQITGNKPELLNTEETGIHLASCSDAVLTEGDYLDADYSKKDYAEETYGYCSYAGLEYPGLEFSPSNYEGAEYASPDYGAPEYGGLQYIHQGYSGGRYVDPTYGYQQYANTEYADSINPDFGPSFMVDAENYIESKDDDDFLQNSAYLDQSVDTQEIAALTSSSCCRISVTNTIAESTQKGYCCKHRRHKVRHQMPKQMFSTGDQTLPSQRPVKVQVTASLSGFTAQPRMLTARRVSKKKQYTSKKSEQSTESMSDYEAASDSESIPGSDAALDVPVSNKSINISQRYQAFGNLITYKSRSSCKSILSKCGFRTPCLTQLPEFLESSCATNATCKKTSRRYWLQIQPSGYKAPCRKSTSTNRDNRTRCGGDAPCNKPKGTSKPPTKLKFNESTKSITMFRGKDTQIQTTLHPQNDSSREETSSRNSKKSSSNLGSTLSTEESSFDQKDNTSNEDLESKKRSGSIQDTHTNSIHQDILATLRRCKLQIPNIFQFPLCGPNSPCKKSGSDVHTQITQKRWKKISQPLDQEDSQSEKSEQYRTEQNRTDTVTAKACGCKPPPDPCKCGPFPKPCSCTSTPCNCGTSFTGCDCETKTTAAPRKSCDCKPGGKKACVCRTKEMTGSSTDSQARLAIKSCDCQPLLKSCDCDLQSSKPPPAKEHGAPKFLPKEKPKAVSRRSIKVPSDTVPVQEGTLKEPSLISQLKSEKTESFANKPIKVESKISVFLPKSSQKQASLLPQEIATQVQPKVASTATQTQTDTIKVLEPPSPLLESSTRKISQVPKSTLSKTPSVKATSAATQRLQGEISRKTSSLKVPSRTVVREGTPEGGSVEAPLKVTASKVSSIRIPPVTIEAPPEITPSVKHPSRATGAPPEVTPDIVPSSEAPSHTVVSSPQTTPSMVPVTSMASDSTKTHPEIVSPKVDSARESSRAIGVPREITSSEVPLAKVPSHATEAPSQITSSKAPSVKEPSRATGAPPQITSSEVSSSKVPSHASETPPKITSSKAPTAKESSRGVGPPPEITPSKIPSAREPSHSIKVPPEISSAKVPSAREPSRATEAPPEITPSMVPSGKVPSHATEAPSQMTSSKAPSVKEPSRATGAPPQITSSEVSSSKVPSHATEAPPRITSSKAPTAKESSRGVETPREITPSKIPSARVPSHATEAPPQITSSKTPSVKEPSQASGAPSKTISSEVPSARVPSHSTKEPPEISSSKAPSAREPSRTTGAPPEITPSIVPSAKVPSHSIKVPPEISSAKVPSAREPSRATEAPPEITPSMVPSGKVPSHATEAPSQMTSSKALSVKEPSRATGAQSKIISSEVPSAKVPSHVTEGPLRMTSSKAPSVKEPSRATGALPQITSSEVSSSKVPSHASETPPKITSSKAPTAKESSRGVGPPREITPSKIPSARVPSHATKAPPEISSSKAPSAREPSRTTGAPPEMTPSIVPSAKVPSHATEAPPGITNKSEVPSAKVPSHTKASSHATEVPPQTTSYKAPSVKEPSRATGASPETTSSEVPSAKVPSHAIKAPPRITSSKAPTAKESSRVTEAPPEVKTWKVPSAKASSHSVEAPPEMSFPKTSAASEPSRATGAPPEVTPFKVPSGKASAAREHSRATGAPPEVTPFKLPSVPPPGTSSSKAPSAKVPSHATEAPPGITSSKAPTAKVFTRGSQAPPRITSSKVPIARESTRGSKAPPEVMPPKIPSEKVPSHATEAPPRISFSKAPSVNEPSRATGAPPKITSSKAPSAKVPSHGTEAPPRITTMAPTAKVSTRGSQAPPQITPSKIQSAKVPSHSTKAFLEITSSKAPYVKDPSRATGTLPEITSSKVPSAKVPSHATEGPPRITSSKAPAARVSSRDTNAPPQITSSTAPTAKMSSRDTKTPPEVTPPMFLSATMLLRSTKAQVVTTPNAPSRNAPSCATGALTTKIRSKPQAARIPSRASKVLPEIKPLKVLTSRFYLQAQPEKTSSKDLSLFMSPYASQTRLKRILKAAGTTSFMAPPAKSEKSCGPNPSQCVGCRLPRTPHRNPMGAFEGDARPGQTCCGKIPADIRPGCAFDKRISKQSSSVKGRCGPRNQAPCQNLRIPCDNLNPCCRRAIETLMEDKDKESKKGKERTKSRSRDYAKDRKNKERTIINGGEERCCTSSTCPASPPPPCCGSGPFSDTTSEGTEGISSLNALPAAGSLVAQGPPQARGSPQAWGSPPSLGPPSEQGRQTPPPMLPPRKSTCPGGGGVPLCNQKCQRHGGQCRPYIHTRQTCPGSKTNESFCSAKLGPIAKGPCPRQKCFVPHMTKAPSMLQPTATMVGQVSADLSAGRGAIPEGNEASDLKLPPQPTKSRERTWENEVCPGMSCIGEEAVTIPTCGLLSCPFKGGIEFSCGPTCGKSKSLYPLAGSLSGPAGVTSNICQCKTKSPLTFRTCICPGFECPRIELETNWPCPCPLPREELHLGDHDPKQVAAERSKLTENTSGFKLSMEKKGLAFEGEISFDEALKFFSDHPEYLPANNTSSQTLVVPDRYHGECCCEDSEMLYDLTSCPGDEPFVSDRIERLQKMEAGRKKEKIPFLIPIREKFKKNKQSDKDKHRYNEKKFTIKDKTVINNKRNACYGQEDIKGKLSELTSANKPKSDRTVINNKRNASYGQEDIKGKLSELTSANKPKSDGTVINNKRNVSYGQEDIKGELSELTSANKPKSDKTVINNNRNASYGQEDIKGELSELTSANKPKSDKTVINNKRNASYGQEDIKGKLSELTSANKPKSDGTVINNKRNASYGQEDIKGELSELTSANKSKSDKTVINNKRDASYGQEDIKGELSELTSANKTKSDRTVINNKRNASYGQEDIKGKLSEFTSANKPKSDKTVINNKRTASYGQEDIKGQRSELSSANKSKSQPKNATYGFTIPAKGAASPGLSRICCFDIVTEQSQEAVPYLLLPPHSDSSTSSDSNTYMLYTL